MIFYNKRYFRRQRFELTRTSLAVCIEGLFDMLEYQISLDQIDHKKRVQVTFNHGLLVVSIFTTIFGLFLIFARNEDAAIFSFFTASIFFVSTLLVRKKTVTIECLDGSNIELFFNNRNKEEVLNYANEIIHAANQCLLRKYGKVELGLSVEPQIHNIQFLRDRNIITEEEYEDLKNELLGKGNKSTIGFGFN